MIDVEPDRRPDGRTARRDRNKDLVLDAVLELFREDAGYPSPAQVAERSGLSLRSVYRYYEDMDELVRAAMARHLSQIQPLFTIEGIGDGALLDRIDRIVTQRFRLYEAVAPMMRAALYRERSNELIRLRLEQVRHELRRQVDAMFDLELAAMDAGTRREVSAALDIVLEFEAIDLLRGQRSLSGPETRRVLIRAVASLLGV